MTHLRHVLLVKGECDVGTAVVLVREAGVAFRGWRGRRGPTFSKTRTRFDKAVLFLDGNTGLACRTPISGLSWRTWFWSTPHLKKKRDTKICISDRIIKRSITKCLKNRMQRQLCYHGAMNLSILTLANVAVFLPFGTISSYLSVSNTGSPNDCERHQQKNMTWQERGWCGLIFLSENWSITFPFIHSVHIFLFSLHDLF